MHFGANGRSCSCALSGTERSPAATLAVCDFNSSDSFQLRALRGSGCGTIALTSASCRMCRRHNEARDRRARASG
eukprot:1999542-Rhodomonas_salina.1